MRKSKHLLKPTGLAILLLFFCSCFSVRIIENIENPDHYFSKTYDKIEKLYHRFPERKGPVNFLNVLVHEGRSRKIVIVRIPIWIVNSCLKLGWKAVQYNRDFGCVRKYEVDWKGMKSLSQFGPGLLVQVEDERDRILIWLK